LFKSLFEAFNKSSKVRPDFHRTPSLCVEDSSQIN